jgi:tRNA-2-methylthio-N6-dimethylallyladenosine synthase
VETFGCQMNEADAALIVGQLARRGYAIVDDPAAADVILVNTCAIRERAEERVYGRTSQLLRHRRDNPGLVIGITGCMAEHLREGLATRAPHVGLVAGPDSYRRIADLVDRARRGERAVDVALDRHEIYEGLDGHPDDDGVSGFVSVQRGCDEFCSFCVVPYTRGRERAVPPREVLRRVRALAAAGYKEITLLGQTVAAYRWEDVGFPDLLRAVGEVDGIARVRFTSPHPRHFDPRLIAALAELPRCCPYVHLPVQSGSDRVLAAMRRGYGRDQFLRIVEDLRTAIPDLALSTDLLVGFCGETEADHRETLALMEEVRFDSAFMFAYSDRGITHAARRLRDDVDPPTKQRRLQEIIDRQEEHTRAAHAARVGREEEILVGGPARRDDRLVGRTARFQSVLLPLDAGRPGDLVRRRIGASTGHSLVVE